MSGEQIIEIVRAYADAPNIRRAERSAAGTMPAGAFQFCEAMRTASSLGWYVYPPKDISLLFDGREVFFFEDDQWFPIKSTNFESSFRDDWAQYAPHSLKELDPPFISELFLPGAIQIWSGYFISSQPGWSVLIRPPVNYNVRTSFVCYEGVVETDRFKPCPLFINLQLIATGREIFISRDRPLFQIQPLLRSSYASGFGELEILELDELDWDGVQNTVRSVNLRDCHRPGNYATSARKRKT